jgi:hypothetical protein
MYKKIDNRLFDKEKTEADDSEEKEKKPAYKAQLEKKDDHAEPQVGEKRGFDQNPERFQKGPGPQRKVHATEIKHKTPEGD